MRLRTNPYPLKSCKNFSILCTSAALRAVSAKRRLIRILKVLIRFYKGSYKDSYLEGFYNVSIWRGYKCFRGVPWVPCPALPCPAD